jgi:hypothetical protein
MSDKREKIKKQHEEHCEFFDKLMVCPNGSRCRKLHFYNGLQSERIIRTLDVLVGNVKDISDTVTVLEEHMIAISENLKLDVKHTQERGRNHIRKSRK